MVHNQAFRQTNPSLQPRRLSLSATRGPSEPLYGFEMQENIHQYSSRELQYIYYIIDKIIKNWNLCFIKNLIGFIIIERKKKH